MDEGDPATADDLVVLDEQESCTTLPLDGLPRHVLVRDNEAIEGLDELDVREDRGEVGSTFEALDAHLRVNADGSARGERDPEHLGLGRLDAFEQLLEVPRTREQELGHDQYPRMTRSAKSLRASTSSLM